MFRLISFKPPVFVELGYDRLSITDIETGWKQIYMAKERFSTKRLTLAHFDNASQLLTNALNSFWKSNPNPRRGPLRLGIIWMNNGDDRELTSTERLGLRDLMEISGFMQTSIYSNPSQPEPVELKEVIEMMGHDFTKYAR